MGLSTRKQFLTLSLPQNKCNSLVSLVLTWALLFLFESIKNLGHHLTPWPGLLTNLIPPSAHNVSWALSLPLRHSNSHCTSLSPLLVHNPFSKHLHLSMSHLSSQNIIKISALAPQNANVHRCPPEACLAAVPGHPYTYCSAITGLPASTHVPMFMHLDLVKLVAHEKYF